MRKGRKAFLLVCRIAQIKTRKGHIFLVTPPINRCIFRIDAAAERQVFPFSCSKVRQLRFPPEAFSINQKTRWVGAQSVQSPLPQRRTVPSSSTCGAFPPSSPSALLSPQTGLRAQTDTSIKSGERKRGGGEKSPLMLRVRPQTRTHSRREEKSAARKSAHRVQSKTLT